MNQVPPPPPAVGLPPPPTRGPPPPVMAATNTVLLTHLPSPLHNRLTLREWLVACGNARNIQFVPPAVNLDEKSDENVDNQIISVLLTMSHPEAALKVVTAFKNFQKEMKIEHFQAHLVTNRPDVPLPPAVMDETTQKVLGEKLISAYQRISSTNGSSQPQPTASSSRDPTSQPSNPSNNDDDDVGSLEEEAVG